VFVLLVDGRLSLDVVDQEIVGIVQYRKILITNNKKYQIK
jgi:hypothetical protein